MTESERQKASSEYYSELKKQLDELLKKDAELLKISEKIRNNIANFNDTAKYSEIVSNYLAKVLQENVGNISSPMGKEYVCKELLNSYYSSINDVLGKVQVSVDSKNNIHIRPQQAPVPTERIEQIAHSLEDTTVSEDVIKRRSGSPVANVAKSFHDDFIKENSDFRSKSGLKCYITRHSSGNCCKWCSAIAGKYSYKDAPHDVFRRHDNCNCTVTYENGRQRQNVWSKEKWQVKGTSKKFQPVKLNHEQAKAIQQNNLNYSNSLKDKQAKMRDFIKQTGQDRDYFREQNYPKEKLLTDFSEKDKKYVDKYFLSGIIKKREKDNFSVEISDLIPETVTKKVNSAIKEVSKKFPVINEQISSIKYGKLDNAYGQCDFNTGTSINEITLWDSLFSDEDNLIKVLHHDAEIHKSYETDHLESLVAHEIGHALHSILALKRTGLQYGKRMTPLEAIAFNNERKKIIQEIYCLYFTDEGYEEIIDECTRQLGTMAIDPNEMIAQAFGNYYYGVKKQPLSKAIVKYFRKELK